MQPQILELNSPALLSDAPVWINKLPCGVPAGFPSPAEDHIVQRVDLMNQLIRHPHQNHIHIDWVDYDLALEKRIPC